MAAADLDALLARLRNFTPEELARVKSVVEELGPNRPRVNRGRFHAFSGILSAEDATTMIHAAEDCEQIDSRDW